MSFGLGRSVPETEMFSSVPYHVCIMLLVVPLVCLIVPVHLVDWIEV